ncbi:hypothetical protein [Guyparkeria halopsychrophila]|uniref:hypothetical protein n=1 Tax=Guyparkeria halopsychrophila TaxID=3139421 RepID=UPI0037C80ECC
MSEYDDIVRGMVAPTTEGGARDTPEAEGGNDYDGIAAQLRKEQTGRARVALGTALDTNPDEAARGAALAKKAGLPLDVVERNRPEIERKTKAEEYDALLESSPKLREKFAADPELAKQAHDDVENLAWWEKSGRISTSMAEPGIRNKAGESNPRELKAAGGGATLATLGIAESEWRTPESITRGFEFLSETVERTGLPRMLNPMRGAETISRAISEGVPVPGTDLRTYGATDAADAIGDATGMLAEDPETFGDTFARLQEKGHLADEALAEALKGDTEKLQQVLTDPEAWAGFIGRAAPSLYMAYKSDGSIPFLAWLESMEVANDAADFEERTGQSIAPEKFVQAQAQVALINAFLERTGLEKIMAGKGGPLTSFMRGAVGEGSTEGLQALNTNAAIFAAYDDQKSPSEGVLGGIMGGAGTGGVAGGVEGTVRRAVERNAKADEAQRTGETIDQVAENARASKLRERNPDAFEEYAAEATADGPVQDVYIDARKFSEFFQSQGIDPAQIAEDMPSVREQLAEAEATGGDLKIPLAEYATRIAATDYHDGLRDLARFNPEDMSPAEAAEWQETQGETFQREAQEILDRRIDDDASQQSARRVEDTVRQQIIETGRFTKDVADKYASLHGAFATTMADRLGIQPAEVYERYGLQVRAEGLQMDGAQYDQGTTLDDVKATAQEAGVDVAVRERDDVITLDKIVVPEDGRGQGTGTQTMQALVDYADAQGKAIALTPTDDFGGNAKRLRDFYKRFGFAENKGADKAYSVSESMLRMPQDSDLTLYQNEGGKRAKIQFPTDLTEAPSVISLLERADLSSFLHESGHFFFEVMTDMAAQPDAPAQIQQDVQTLLDWYGIDSLETWQQMTPDARREYHEQFARGFEAYLLEGNAPSVEMQGLFQRFRAWLVAVYKNLRNLDVELTDEVRGVFDRMLATDEQIEAAQASMNLRPMFRSADEAGMTEAEFAEYQARHREAIDEATETLQERSLRDMQWLANAKSRKLKELQREAKTKRKAVRAEVADEVAHRPVYAAEEFLRRGIVEGPDGERIDIPSGNKLAIPAMREMYGEEDAPRSDPDAVDPALDDLPTAIAKLGGLDREAASAEGIDPAHWQGRAASTENQPVSGRRVFRKEGGRAFDSMAEALAQYGYLDEEATPNALLDKLNASLRGEEVYSSRADFDAIYGVPGADLVDAPDWRSLGYGKYGMLAGTGVDPEVAAGWFGFTSADEMVRTLVDAEPRREVIEAETDLRMLERYGDLADPQAMERAAEAAIHNDARARFAATELNYLNRAAGRGRVNTQAAKAFAERFIAGQRVREIKPSRWQSAEARAARESDKARRQGDLPAAARAKQDQVVQGYTVRAAQDAVTEIDKMVNYLKKFEREGVRKNLRGDFVGQMDALLARFDLRKGQSLKAIDQRQNLREWIESFSQENAAIAPEIDERMLDEAYRKHYKDMTLDELRGLRDTVRQLEQLARREQKMYLESRQQTFNEEKGAILDELRNAHPEAFDADGEPRGFEKSYVPKFGERWKRLKQKGSAEFINVETLVQLVTVGKFGQLHDSLVQRLSDRSDWKVKFQQQLGDHLRPYLKAYGFMESREFAAKKNLLQFSSKAYFIPEINESLTRENMVTAALYYGSVTGRQRLRDGHGWGPAEMRAITDRLTQKDVDLIEAIWQMHDEMVWPELKGVNERTTGQAPEKVEPLPFDTKFGTLRGGFHPIVYDSDLDHRQAKYDEGQAVQDMLGGNLWKASTPQGSSKARLDEVSKRLTLDFGGMNKALGDAIHDIAYREAVADTYRLVNDKTLRAAIDGIGGVDVTRAIEQQIRNVASVPRAPSRFIDAFLSKARQNTLIVTMGYSIKTFLINATGISASWRRVGLATLSQEVGNFSANPFETTRFVNERSTYMEYRNRSYDRDLTRQVAQIQAKKRITPDVATALAMVGWMDRAVSYPTWMAAYKEALNGKVRFEPKMDPDRAAKYADHIVRQTQGSGREVDVAQIMEGRGDGGQLRSLFTMFYSYFNAQLAQMVRAHVVEGAALRNGDPWALARLAQAYLSVIVLPAVLGALLYGNCDSDVDSNGAAAGYAKCFTRESVLFAGGFVPIIRDVIAGLWASFDDDAPYYGYQISPVASAIEGPVRGVKSMGDVAGGEGDIRDVRAITLGTSYALGLPGYQAWRSMEHAYNVAEGESDFNAWYLLMGEPYE